MIYNITPLIKWTEFEIRNRIDYRTDIKLDIIKTSDDFASEKYINAKIKKAQQLGIKTRVITPEEMGESDAHGIIVQLPVDNLRYDADQLIARIPDHKDVDGLKSVNMGEVTKFGHSDFSPCTARGITAILDTFFNNDLAGKNVVIVGRSNLVGKPLSMMLLGMDCTVTICHSMTPRNDLLRYIKNADAVVVAVGQKGFITRDMLKVGAFVVDVGINRDSNGKVCGDVGQSVITAPDVFTTPVPGGVGKMTVLGLMENTVNAYDLA